MLEEPVSFQTMKKTIVLLFAFLSCMAALRAQPCTLPTDLFTSDTLVVCTGTSTDLQVPLIAGAVYNWSTAEANERITVSVNGRYWVSIQDAGCSVSDTVTVLFNSFLLSPPVSDLFLCKGRAAQPIRVEGQQVQWYTDPIGGTGQSSYPVPSTADTGRSTYWFTQTLFGCESPRVPMLVRVIDKPAFELGEAFIIPCGAAGITLQVVDDGFSTYRWSNGSSGVSMLAPSRGQYSLYAENMCGSHRDTTVAVECQDKCVQFPSAFTPNQDGLNDRYQPACFCPVPSYKLTIFNRNGEMVFQTNNPQQGWDGYFRGQLQPNGAYVYFTEFFDFVLKQSFRQKGSFVLLR